MGYANFKTISHVAEKFNCDVIYKDFVKQKEFICDEWLLKYINKNLNDRLSYASEASICETIIRPIISTVAEENKLPVWSHVLFDVDKELDLTGTPDYLLAPGLPGNATFKLPIVCLGEAKKDDFEAGWGQTAAEMKAAQIKNNNEDIPILGLVTNGKAWEFGKFEDNIFTIESKSFTTNHLDEIFNVLNWMFCIARKNADILLEIEAKEKEDA